MKNTRQNLMMSAAALGLSAASLTAATLAGELPAPVKEVPPSKELPATSEDPASEQATSRYLRVLTEDEQSLALEIASTRFVPIEGDGPAVTLVGVVHVGDRAYYRQLQEMLGGFDVVLYESVKPAGTGSLVPESLEGRRAATQAGLQFVRAMLESYRSEMGEYPDDLAALRRFAGQQDPRMASFLDEALIDAWRHDVRYEIAPEDGSDDYRLLSFGGDAAPGGEDEAADVSVDRSQAPAALLSSEEDNIQAQLAESLRLSFQLDEMDYGAANWRSSDMSLDEVERALQSRGLDIAFLEDAIGGSGIPGRIARLLLGFVRFADALTDGAVSDTVKVVLIEMLGDESLVELSLVNFDKGFAEVIIDERNQVVVDDLKRVLEEEPDAESIAIFYGAGHMQDLAERLETQLDYEREEAEWMAGIRVDLKRSSISKAQLAQLRMMVRQAIWQMQKAAEQEG